MLCLYHYFGNEILFKPVLLGFFDMSISFLGHIFASWIEIFLQGSLVLLMDNEWYLKMVFKSQNQVVWSARYDWNVATLGQSYSMHVYIVYTYIYTHIYT